LYQVIVFRLDVGSNNSAQAFLGEIFFRKQPDWWWLPKAAYEFCIVWGF